MPRQSPLNPTVMSKGEREDLQRLVRQREKVLKSAARQRSSELLADFENQLGSTYKFDEDETWAAAAEAAEREVAKAEARVAARCAELGIPKRFAPSLDLQWYSRGENAVKERRAELRKMATTRIEAIERDAIVKIEMASVTAQTEIAVAGLTSDAARAFAAKLLDIEVLMPKLLLAAIADEAAPPVAEQLVSPNALRQRRWRERQAALRRNGGQALQEAPRNADSDDENKDGDGDDLDHDGAAP
ncbi:MAG: hypothetical protein ACLP0B_14950 [Steroidobacteraceae bacterium]